MIPVLTIDGPSGAGKGTVTQMVAQKLGWHILDSGALYRLTALSAKKQGVSFDDADALADIALGLNVSFPAGEPGEPVGVLLDGEDVSSVLRTEETGMLASKVAVVGEVRAALLDRQRAFRESPGLVADGRDMGTVVFPDTPFKVYLTASAEARADRRYKQLKQMGQDVKIAHLLSEIQARDERDMGRSNAPLKPADDALIIDTSTLSIEEVVQQVFEIINTL